MAKGNGAVLRRGYASGAGPEIAAKFAILEISIYGLMQSSNPSVSGSDRRCRTQLRAAAENSRACRRMLLVCGSGIQRVARSDFRWQRLRRGQRRHSELSDSL